MAGERVRTRFGDVVEFVSEKAKASDANLQSYVSTENMLPDFGGVVAAASIPTSGSITRFQCGDVLFSNIRTYFKKVWRANFSGYCSNDVLVFRAKNERVILPAYVHNLCRWEKFTELSVRTSKGAKMPRGDKEAMAEFEFDLPPLAEQRAIAHILGTLDDKIELNRRRNETLEAMARALFKDWFVDFDPVRAKMQGRKPYLPPDLWQLFPDRLDEEGKPDGWDEKPLDEIADFLNGLALQKYPATDPVDSLPVIKIAELRSGITAKSDRASRDVPPKYHVKDGDFLFSWSGSLLAKFWTDGEGALNQHLFNVTSNHYPMWFISQWVHHHLQDFQAIAASKATTMGHIQRGHLNRAMTVCPTNEVIMQLGEVMSPFASQVIGNELESRDLTRIRDTLLPKSISGELHVELVLPLDKSIS